MEPAFDVDQLCRDPHAIVGLSDTALQQGRDVELFADHAQVLGLALELKGGGPAGHAQVANAGKGVDQLFGEAVREVLLVALRAHVGERQHGDGRRHGANRGIFRRDATCAGGR